MLITSFLRNQGLITPQPHLKLLQSFKIKFKYLLNIIIIYIESKNHPYCQLLRNLGVYLQYENTNKFTYILYFIIC